MILLDGVLRKLDLYNERRGVERALHLRDALGTRGGSSRTRLWRQGITVTTLAVLAFTLASPASFGQASAAPASPDAQSSSTSTDLFVMMGSDLDRPGALPRANYNIGIGHTFGFLKKDPIGDELTFSYTYENAGTHGFLHTQYGEHTETFGVMKNFSIPKAKSLGGYTWLQMGPTTYTGLATLQTHLYSGAALGLVIHFNDHNGIWIQESYNKVVTVPWYTTSSIGYTRSW